MGNNRMVWTLADVILVVAALLFSVPPPVQAALPQDYQTFKARYQKEAHTPAGALKLYFEAVFCYINEETRAEGSKMLRYAMRVDRPLEKSANYATFLQRLRDPQENYVFRSFAAGATPENDYRMAADAFDLVIEGMAEEADYTRVLLRSGGADNARVVWVKAFDGLWFTINNAGTYAQVHPPQSFATQRANAHDADYDTPPAQ